jgi:Arc/MetJ-type ribon-helix-helix transcriptional regulator
MTEGKSSRVLVTLPLDTAVRVHEHRIRGRFRSESAAMADLIRSGLEWIDGAEARRDLDEQLQRLRFWRESIP